MKNRHIESATKILKDMKYMTIATVCEDGSPWNTPVAPNLKNDLVFTWGSSENSIHSQNIRK
ncbi:MAG: pyridoxamine 5'-phosphate oxidase family protein [Minisyncoccia bacterium]